MKHGWGGGHSDHQVASGGPLCLEPQNCCLKPGSGESKPALVRVPLRSALPLPPTWRSPLEPPGHPNLRSQPDQKKKKIWILNTERGDSPLPLPILDCFEFQEKPGGGPPSPVTVQAFEVQTLRKANRPLAGCQRTQRRTEGASYWESAVSRAEIRPPSGGGTAIKFTALPPSSRVHSIQPCVYLYRPVWEFHPTVAF